MLHTNSWCTNFPEVSYSLTDGYILDSTGSEMSSSCPNSISFDGSEIAIPFVPPTIYSSTCSFTNSMVTSYLESDRYETTTFRVSIDLDANEILVKTFDTD